MSNRSPTQTNIDDGFSITVRQVEALVKTIGYLKEIRGQPYPDDDDEDDWKKLMPEELDGGSKVAIEVAMSAAAERLTAILRENSRWTRQANRFRKKVEELFDAQIETQQEASFNESLKRRPTIVYRPDFVKLKDGRWAAFLTDDRGVPSVVGSGPTPEAAAYDFDQVFLGGRSPSVENPTPEHAQSPRQDATASQPAEERSDPPSS